MRQLTISILSLLCAMQVSAQTESAPKRFGQENSNYNFPLYGDVESIIIDSPTFSPETLKFNERGDLIEHPGESYEGMREHYYYIYDDFGNNLLTICQTCSEGPYNILEPYDGVSFYISNNRDGNIAKISFYEGKYTPEWSEIYKKERNQENSEIRRVYNGGLLIQEGPVRYSYDTNSKLIRKREYSNDKLENLWWEWKYDNQGREVEFIQYSNNSEILNITRTTYNAKGQKTLVTNSGPYLWVGDVDSCGSYPLPRQTVYTYNEKGQLIEEASTMEEYDMQWVRYAYDSHGNVIEVKYIYDNGYEYSVKYIINYR